MKERHYTDKSTGMPSVIFTPDESGTTSPGHCLLYLHGSSGFGKDVDALFGPAGLPRMLREGLALEMSVVIPVCISGDQWAADPIERFVQGVFDNCFETAPTLSVAGFSRGAGGVWRFVAACPHRVQNAIAISGRKELYLAGRLNKTPFWVFHGTEDERISSSESIEMAAQIRHFGGSVRLTLLEGENHYITTYVFEQKEVHEWLLETTAG